MARNPNNSRKAYWHTCRLQSHRQPVTRLLLGNRFFVLLPVSEVAQKENNANALTLNIINVCDYADGVRAAPFHLLPDASQTFPAFQTIRI